MGDAREEYLVVCPDCGERLVVNEAMKETLGERGCIICGSVLATDSFTVTPSRDFE